MPIITKEENRETHPNLEQGQIPGTEEATTAKIKIIQCENLFSGVSPIKKNYDERAAQQGEKFNLFKILNIHADEVRLHSRFLAEFLNPKGAHLQGAKFLELFVRQFFPDFDFNAETAKVKIEKVIDNNRRLDIHLRDDKRREIIIENKIYAGDQNKQLYDYYEFAKKSAQDFRLIYLTLKGTDPSANSSNGLQKDQDYICLSYQEDIATWLKACQNEVLNIPLLSESIHQYLLNISFLTNQSMNQGYLKEIEGVLAENGNYLLVNDIQEALTLLKITSLEKLMIELFQALKDHFKLSDGDVFFMDKKTKIEQHKLNELIQGYYQKNKVSQFGICLRLYGTAAPNLALKIELHHSLYYGFAVLADDSQLIPWNDMHTNFPEAFAKINALSTNFSTKDNPFLYRKVVAESDKIYFHPDSINADGLNILINSATRKEWVESFVEGIEEVLELMLR